MQKGTEGQNEGWKRRREVKNKDGMKKMRHEGVKEEKMGKEIRQEGRGEDRRETGLLRMKEESGKAIKD